MRRVLWSVLSLCLLLPLLVEAQDACVPTITTKTNVQLTWDAIPAPEPGITLTGLLFERQLGTQPWTVLAAPPLSATTAMDMGLAVGTTARYRLRLEGRLADGTVLRSDFATHGVPAPCVTVQALPSLKAPTHLSLTPQ